MSTSDKLTYLNTTKTKIREGLNSLGADLDTEDTFRSYADAIEGIYEDYPKITGEGTDLSLDNTKQASMKIDLKGNTSQNGTPTPSSPIPVNVVSGDNTITIANSDDTESQSYNVNLGTLELCKIGTYQDYIYKDNGSWYLHKEIGKVVLDGSENWALRNDVSQASGYYTFRNNDYIAGEFTTNSFGYSNYYEVVTIGNAEKNNIRLVNSNGYGTQICINGDIAKTPQELKSWLSTHNTIVYYVLATPTNTEITDATLIEQLEELKLATSYEGQTNISQVNNDLPFILDVKALRGE